MPTLVFRDGVLSLSISHIIKRPDGTLIYQRRVPKDLLHLYDGKTFMPRRSLGRPTPSEAAKKVAVFAKRDEDEWASLRAHPSTPEHISAQVDARLAKWRLKAREQYPDEATPTEYEHLWELLDDHLLDTYGDTYDELKQDNRYKSIKGTEALKARVSALDYETYRRVISHRPGAPTPPLLSRVLEEYLRIKGAAFERKGAKGVRLALGSVFSTVGDRPLSDYTRDHARKVLAAILEGGVKTTSARRRLNDIRAVFNIGRVEFDLTAFGNPFEGLKIPNEGEDATKRGSFTPEEMTAIVRVCSSDLSTRGFILGLLAETGARLEEIVGMRSEDVFLDVPVPHVWIRPHKEVGRGIKTHASNRKVPLVGVALQVARQMPKGNAWLFPEYAEDHKVKAGAASARLNPLAQAN